MILWLRFDNGRELGLTPAHEVWTYQDGWTFAGTLDVGDAFVGVDGQPVTIVDVRVFNRHGISAANEATMPVFTGTPEK